MGDEVRLTAWQRAALEDLARPATERRGRPVVNRRQLPALHKRGLVTNVRDGRDRRRVVWAITDAGRLAIGQLLTVRAAGTLDLTVHLKDPDVAPKLKPGTGAGSLYRALIEPKDNTLEEDRFQVREWNGHAGATVCGKPLLLEELWVRHEPEEGVDKLCTGCFGGEPTHDEPALWWGEDADDGGLEEWPDPDEEPERRVETVKVAGSVL